MQLTLAIEEESIDAYEKNLNIGLLQEIKSKAEKVKFIMEQYPDARNNDSYLCVQYWKLVDGVTAVDDIIASTKPEVIRRARQKIQEAGMMLPTDPEIAQRRRIHAEEIRVGINQLKLF